MTAKNQVADLVESFAVGANDYLSKPVNKHELLTRVETHLKLLDVNRNLERKVADRTEALEQKNREIIQTQQQLVQVEKMASLGNLTAGVAHEINNPTNAVHNSAHNLGVDLADFQQFLLALAGPDADVNILDSFRQRFAPLQDHLKVIEDGTRRIKTIVEDLRAFSQLDGCEHKTVIITDCLQSTINLVKTKNQAISEFICDFKSTPELLCYPAQLNQVFMNLINNAVDAIERKGLSSPSEEGQIVVGCQTIDNRIVITIKDNGCGIIEADKSKLFEPFYTTKDIGQGTGLGLSIAFGIVQKHGGELSVESQLGKGSVFRLELPF
ncbi:MAG: GHKL domain-containing protein [Algicola sp.]|nr:GHKL domain-containing protein [Algicola sp.]